MFSHEVGIFGGEEYPFFPILGSPFLFDHSLYGPAHQAGTSCHQHPEWSSVTALTVHLEKARHKNTTVSILISAVSIHRYQLCLLALSPLRQRYDPWLTHTHTHTHCCSPQVAQPPLTHSLSAHTTNSAKHLKNR